MLPARSTFSYEVVPDVTAAALRAQASRIRKMVSNTTKVIIEIGRDLLAVKESLVEHGHFREWVEAECGLKLRTAENYMRAAEFAEGRTATVALLNPGIVYRLAAKSAPAEIVQSVLDRTAKGEVVSDDVVIAAFNEAKFQKREAERRQKKSKAQSKKVREQRERERLQQDERRRKEEERILVVAHSIIETLGEKNTSFLLKNLGKFDGWSILDRVRTEFFKQHPDVVTRAAIDLGVPA